MPVIRLDLIEPDPPGNIETISGQVRRVGGEPVGRFSPGFVSRAIYANGQPVQPGDYLHLNRKPCGPCHVYGHEIQQHDRTWLQYWMWFCGNGFHWSTRGWHLGDWQSVTLRLGPDGVPDLAAYAQHRRGETRPWHRVRKRDGRPLVFSDLGSHASRFDRTIRGSGLREVESELVVVDDETPWIGWDGYWGQSRAAHGRRWADSPRGPAFHREWSDPAGLVASL